MAAKAPMLVLQHIACEPPAAYEDELLSWEIDVHRVEIDEGDVLPDWRGFAGIVAMGGPVGAYEDEALPWLRDEKRLIGEAVRANHPYWGVCLGAQLLAASFGAEVRPGSVPEVGVLPVDKTTEGRADPVFKALPDRFETLQWHGDTYDLPTGAVRLARSHAVEQQAFVVQRAYGLQFHLEVTAALAAEWAAVPAYADSLEAVLGPGAMESLLQEMTARAEDMGQLARRAFAAWLEHVVGVSA